MIEHNLTLAWRQLVKSRLQSAVSIVSLAIGFACFALASMWIKYETTYDGFHKDAENIYCLIREDRAISAGRPSWYSTIPVTDSIITYCPEINTYTAFDRADIRELVLTDNDSIAIRDIKALECDKSFFDFFSVKFILGDSDFLEENDKVAVTQEIAERLWGKENPIGKQVKFNANENVLTVAAVVEGWGEHTNIPFAFIRNKNDLFQSGKYSYRQYAFRLHPNVDVDKLNEKLAQMPQFDLPEHNPMEMDCTWSVVPLIKWHNLTTSHGHSFNLNHIYLFFIAGGLLILCGLLNYLTMFLNRLFIRQREMVLRSVFGATGKQLMMQFLVEYGLLLIIALFFGNYAIKVSLNWFLELSGLPADWNYFHRESLLYLLLVVITSLFISCPPIWYFRRRSLQSSIQVHNELFSYGNFRKFSTCLQLCIAIFCIFCTVVLQKQLNELRHGDIGFDHERTIRVAINLRNQGSENEREDFLHYLRQQPEVESLINGYPLYPRGPFTTYLVNKTNNPDLNVQASSIVAYYDWDGELSRFHNLRLIKGRLLQPGEDPSNVVINESTAKLYDWDSPIGKRILRGFTIIGVVKDFQNNGPTMPAQPSMLVQKREEDPSQYIMKYSVGKWSDHQKKYEEYIKSIGSSLYISFLPVSDNFNADLAREDKLQTLLTITTGVCILIALFGVWSMIMLTCEQRRKEIAIRKVHGATVKDILDMFFLEYMSLQAVAALVAFPIGYACMKPWLEQYVVQTEISWWIYVGIFLFVALLVALCIGWRVWKTATARPADEICKG